MLSRKFRLTGMSFGSLQVLPPELLLEVENSLPLVDRLSLSTTRASWRKLLVPKLFSNLRVTNRDDDQQILNNVLDKYGCYVQQLHFECYLFPDEDSDSDEDNNDEASKQPDLPNFLYRLLKFEGMPAMRGILVVDFKAKDNFDGESWGGDPPDLGSIYMHAEVEDEHTIAHDEHEHQWRANIAQVWALIATNRSIRELTIVNLPPRATSAWFTAEWHSFLGQLEELSVCVWGGDNGAGWNSNTTSGYVHFFSQLGNYFFYHTKSLRRLSITADAENPYCFQAFGHAPPALDPAGMPVLRSLYLENCFIDTALVSFLQAHAKTIKQLHLQNCLCTLGEFMVPGPVMWAELFEAVRGSEPILEDLRVHVDVAPLTHDEEFPQEGQRGPDGAFVPPDDEPDDVKAIRRTVREGRRKVFPYFSIDGKYGMIFSDKELNIERFEGYEDQRQHDALLDLVQENARRRS